MDLKIKEVWFDKSNIYIRIKTGHTIGNPLEWYGLEKTTPEQLERYIIGTFGESIHWPDLDVDIHLEGFFDFKRELNYAKL